MADAALKQASCRSPKILGFLLVCFLLAIQPFHTIASAFFSYYRELIGVILLLLSPFCFRSGSSSSTSLGYRLLMVSSCSLFLYALGDSGTSLYAGVDITRASTSLAQVDPVMYVLRNALLYVPLVIFLATRGLTLRETRVLCAVVAIAAPFSIIHYLRESGILYSVGGLSGLGALGGRGLSYNTYVPYLTFPFSCALYMYHTQKRCIERFLYFSIATLLFGYIFVSTSRQSLLYCVILIMAYLVYVVRARASVIIIIALAGIATDHLMGLWASQGYA